MGLSLDQWQGTGKTATSVECRYACQAAVGSEVKAERENGVVTKGQWECAHIKRGTLEGQSMPPAENGTYGQSTGGFFHRKENKVPLKGPCDKERQTLTASGQTSVRACLPQLRVMLLFYK